MTLKPSLSPYRSIYVKEALKVGRNITKLMRTSLIIAVVLIVLVIAIAATYLLMNQNNPEKALLNARKLLLSSNFTGTYDISSIVKTYPPGSSTPRVVQSSGVVIISRSPALNATVANSTGISFINGKSVSSSVINAYWLSDDKLCQVLIAYAPSSGIIKYCIPYNNYTRYRFPFYITKELLSNATYVGEGSWNGKTTYCFASKIMAIEPSITISPPNGTIIGPPWSVITTNATICILGNGVIASLIEYTYAVPTQPSLSATTVTITNETLISYSLTFNQQLFNQITQLMSKAEQG
jgi:hypothetical protein